MRPLALCCLLAGTAPAWAAPPAKGKARAAGTIPLPAVPGAYEAPGTGAPAVSSPTVPQPDIPRWSTGAYIAAVLDASPEIKQSREVLFSAGLNLNSQVAQAYLPTVSLSAALTPSKFAIDNTKFTFATWRLNANDLNVTPSVNWNLFNSFRDMRSIKSSRLGLEMTRQDLEASLQSHALRALQAYYGLLLADKLLEVARQSYQAQKEQYDLTLDQYKHGMKSLSALLKTETDLQTRELSVSESEAQRGMALFTFNVLINRPENAPTALDDSLVLGTTTMPSLDAGLRAALVYRPEMVKSRLSLEQADVAYRQAIQNVLPSASLDFGASHAWSTDYGSRRDDFGWRTSTYGLTLSLSLPASFNFYSQVQSARVAASTWRRSRLADENLVRGIRQEVYQAHIELMRAVRAYAISVRAEDISKQNLDLILEQYNQGSADVIALSQARLDYVTAQTQKMTAFRDANIQRAQYRAAVGEPVWR